MSPPKHTKPAAHNAAASAPPGPAAKSAPTQPQRAATVHELSSSPSPPPPKRRKTREQPRRKVRMADAQPTSPQPIPLAPTAASTPTAAARNRRPATPYPTDRHGKRPAIDASSASESPSSEEELNPYIALEHTPKRRRHTRKPSKTPSVVIPSDKSPAPSAFHKLPLSPAYMAPYRIDRWVDDPADNIPPAEEVFTPTRKEMTIIRWQRGELDACSSTVTKDDGTLLVTVQLPSRRVYRRQLHSNIWSKPIRGDPDWPLDEYWCPLTPPEFIFTEPEDLREESQDDLTADDPSPVEAAVIISPISTEPFPAKNATGPTQRSHAIHPRQGGSPDPWERYREPEPGMPIRTVTDQLLTRAQANPVLNPGRQTHPQAHPQPQRRRRRRNLPRIFTLRGRQHNCKLMRGTCPPTPQRAHRCIARLHRQTDGRYGTGTGLRASSLDRPPINSWRGNSAKGTAS